MMVEAGFPVIAKTGVGIAFSRGLPDGECLGAVWLRQHL